MTDDTKSTDYNPDESEEETMETEHDQTERRTLRDRLVDAYCESLVSATAEKIAEELVSWAAKKVREEAEPQMMGFCPDCGNLWDAGTYARLPCPSCAKKGVQSGPPDPPGSGVPVRVKLGPHASQAEIYADKDGEEVNLLKLLPVTRLQLEIDGNDADTKLTLEIETVEAFADKVRAQLSEDDLRWIAKLHGYALVRMSPSGLFNVHITCPRCSHVTMHRMAGKMRGLRCYPCGWTCSAEVSVDDEGWTSVTVEPSAAYAEVEPMRVSDD